MSHITDKRFAELAMKLVSFECSAEEKAELRRCIEQETERREELQELCLSAGIARELLPLANALEAAQDQMSVDEINAFKEALSKRRELKRIQESRSRAGLGRNPTPTVGDSPVIDVQAEPPTGGTVAPSSKPRSRIGLQRLIVLSIVLAVALVSLLFLISNRDGGIQWKFAIVQPLLNRSDLQMAPLLRYLDRNFSNASTEIMQSRGQEMQDWESSRTPNMVQVKCILEGIRLHPSWLVDRFEVKGWRANGSEFQKTIHVQNGDWTNAIKQVRVFVHDH